jgi:Uma2 family endonuclease
VVVAMSPQGDDHWQLVSLLTRLLARRLPPELMVVPQCTYRLARTSAPEPDLAIVTAASVWKKRSAALWLIEVAVTSQRKDRGVKATLYATGGIAEYWVVDAKTMSVHVHRDPDADEYRSITRHDRFAQLASQAVPSLIFSLDDLLNDRVPL